MSIVAAFDFDHTLTDRDSLWPFLVYMHGLKAAGYLASLSLPALRFGLGCLSRQAMKERLLTRCLAGYPMAALAAIGQRYAHERLDGLLTAEGQARLAWHRTQGHRCLLVSASLSFYLKPWAQRHGFEEVLCSHLEVDGGGCVTGRLLGLNCWGPEKARRLLSYLGPREQYELYAYGDSRGDREMLALADHPFYRMTKRLFSHSECPYWQTGSK